MSILISDAIMEEVAGGTVNHADILLLAIIDSLSKTKQGCFASNEYLAKILNVSQRSVGEYISRFKKTGIVEQIRFDGKRRYLKTKWTSIAKSCEADKDISIAKSCEADKDISIAKSCEADSQDYVDQPHRITYPHHYINKAIIKNTLSVSRKLDDDTTFDVAPKTLKPTAKSEATLGLQEPHELSTRFVSRATTELEKAVRKLPPRQTGIIKARPSTWGRHIQLLHTKDKISQETIKTVLQWYCAHIADEFTPHAYSGEAFRKKFDKIEDQMKRIFSTTLENIIPSPQATRIAEQVSGMGWPKGSEKTLSRACQACLSAYQEWWRGVHLFLIRLEQEKNKNDETFLRFGRYLESCAADPAYFIMKWMGWVNYKVQNWKDWDGGFSSFLFRPESKQFKTMGRGWANDFAGDFDLWDRFCETMNKQEK